MVIQESRNTLFMQLYEMEITAFLIKRSPLHNCGSLLCSQTNIFFPLKAKTSDIQDGKFRDVLRKVLENSDPLMKYRTYLWHAALFSNVMKPCVAKQKAVTIPENLRSFHFH